jgi:hypothetical protein
VSYSIFSDLGLWKLYGGCRKFEEMGTQKGEREKSWGPHSGSKFFRDGNAKWMAGRHLFFVVGSLACMHGGSDTFFLFKECENPNMKDWSGFSFSFFLLL